MRRFFWLLILSAASLPLQAEEPAAAPVVAESASGLMAAAERDDLEAVRRLLKAGASAKTANRYGITPLFLACQHGNPEMTTLLLEAGADANARGTGGGTALMTAARTGVADCVKALLAAGAKVDATERRQQTALMWAAHEGHTAVVELLLAAGADFRTPLKSGFTPLLFAVRQGRLATALALVKAGADVNQPAAVQKSGSRTLRDGSSALMLAVENAHYELAVALVKAGAEVNDQRSGFSPLHAVVGARRTPRGDGDDGIPPPAGSGKVSSLELVRVLVAAGADLNARMERSANSNGNPNIKGATAFLLAAANSDLALLQLLHGLGADPTLPNADNCPPLLAACGVGGPAPGEEPGTEAEALATVNWLLDLGADINATDHRGETAMHGAAYKISPGLVTLLDQRGADITTWNCPNKSGWTPLLIAQGFRQGNFRPIAEMEEIISKVMRTKGIAPPPAPPQKAANDYRQ